ncbi:MAG: peroxide stress protein YaaA [Thermoleophilia bacterium]|nr:peroxide stress protein YaaA [Thermoleophilia bacterium]
MLLLLPPSETKAAGGDGPPLDLDRLSFPELTRQRDRVRRALSRLAASPRRSREVLGLGPRQEQELAFNEQLLEAPTMPAIERYTGVLYDSLDVGSMRAAQRRRADSRLAIGSALFGIVRADDPIPAYRLSGSTKLPRLGSLVAVWKPGLEPVLADLAESQLVVDLRSGAYRSLAPAGEAVTVRVLSERADGSRTVVSHANKATKGRIARVLAIATTEPRTIQDVAALVEADGLRVELVDDRSLDVVVDA